MEVEVECVKNKSRGIAVLKLYGPSTKRQNVVMVTAGYCWGNKKMDISQKENKKRKQGLKDLRKVINKNCKKNEDISKQKNETKPIQNIKDIP